MSIVRVATVAGMVSCIASQHASAGEGAEPDRKELEMAEDLEVLGEVVARGIERFYSDARVAMRLEVDSGLPMAQYSIGADPHSVGTPLSVHLPGYGVVLQLEAPYLRDDAQRPGKRAATPKAQDDWDLARRRLEGAPSSTKEEPRRAEPTRAGLVDALVNLMARNGHRLRHLGGGERLTLALELKARASGDAGVSRSREGGGANWVEGGPDFVRTLDALNVFDRGGNVDALDRALDNQLRSGDMHLRQGNYEKAIETFRQASEDHRDAAVRARLLHALAGAGKYEEARSLLDDLAQGKGSAGDAGNGTAARGEARGLALSARLVLSAPGDALEKVGTGSISLEEFRKEVQVTSFQPPPGRVPKSGEASWGNSSP